MKSHLLIPTAGRPDLLGRLLDSLLACERPKSLDSIVVIENGEPSGAQDVIEWARTGLPLEYLWSLEPCKSTALNAALAHIDDEALVIMTDDDVRFEPQTLVAYEQEASRAGSGWFFGGPFGADFESAPEDWLLSYLPPSAKGWSPSAEGFDSSRDRFFGCNWAAWASDLRAIGEFDARYGPGSTNNATGQENEAQRRLHTIGRRSRLVPDAKVWHWVPASRCSPEWALERARRSGVERGIRVGSRGSRYAAADNVMNAVRLSSATAESVFFRLGGGSGPFRAEYRRCKAAGYFEGLWAAAHNAEQMS